MIKRIVLILALVMALGMVGCGGSTKEPAQATVPVSTETTSQETTSEDIASEPSLTSNEIAITETTIVDGFECSIKEINWYSANDFDFDVIQKEEGYEYIVIVLSEKNTTNNTENAPMINILAADGQECITVPALSLYKKQYKINFGATMANTTANAYMIYKIPEGSQSFKLQILSNGFGSNSKYFVFDRYDIH